MELTKKLSFIQQALKAPKNQLNAFGHYNYRSAEDILEAVKPLLGDCTLTLTDEVVMVGTRYYVKATTSLKDADQEYAVSAFARESEDKKGMDSAQITGAASSYARKYALNGLFAIDDTKDADTQDNTATVANIAKLPPPTVNPVVASVQKAYTVKVVGETCPDCGGKYVKSPKTGSVFCENKCWVKK